ncbi:MAG: hypothetical protein QHH10_10485 [Peptococcaceae bacterium]|jgi:hypothetical protein|nr:flagellar hook-length control protein FliK [Peptococcaceae bacterium]MDH7525724.1 hypothetical protein [Peptococcaceae bacterium]
MGLEIKNSFSNLVTMLKNPDGTAWETVLKLAAGQEVVALVAGKEGDVYLLQVGERSFLAKSEIPLETGEVIKLIVLGPKDQAVLLKKIPFFPVEKEETITGGIKQLLARQGITGEKETGKLISALKRIPVEEKTGLRYLLDPHLVAAVLLNAGLNEEKLQRIEINRYKSQHSSKDVYEIWMGLNMNTLGRIEVAIKMVEENIFARIWAELPETESILRERKDEIQAVIAAVEIVPVMSGPIFPRKQDISLDIKV